MAVMASETDLRMFVQQGCFTVHSLQAPISELIGAERFLQKLVIPASVVLGFAAEIDACGFRQGDIFPDLEHLAAELKHAATQPQAVAQHGPAYDSGYAGDEH
jgi:hypothetical protein